MELALFSSVFHKVYYVYHFVAGLEYNISILRVRTKNILYIKESAWFCYVYLVPVTFL